MLFLQIQAIDFCNFLFSNLPWNTYQEILPAARVHDTALMDRSNAQAPTGLAVPSPASKANDINIRSFLCSKFIIRGELTGNSHPLATGQDGCVRGQSDASSKNANQITGDISTREEFPGFSSPADAAQSGTRLYLKMNSVSNYILLGFQTIFKCFSWLKSVFLKNSFS